MALKIRLARSGSKNRPYYNIVVAENTSPRDGKFIEEVGFYNPLEKDDSKKVSVKKERTEFWLSKGAQPTDRVVLFLKRQDVGQNIKFVQDLNKKSSLKIKATALAQSKKKELEAKKAEGEQNKQA